MKTALNQFGAGITDETTFREYADKINDIYDNWEKVTGEGTDITLNNTKKGKLDFKDPADNIIKVGSDVMINLIIILISLVMLNDYLIIIWIISFNLV